MDDIYSVSQFNAMADNLVSSTFRGISIKGEISECKSSRIGAIYFSLCDEGSSVSCVIFPDKYSSLGFELAEGMKVVVSADASIYKKKGTFQLLVRSVKRDGIGSIIEKIMQNAALWKDTYFARQKRPIPSLVRNIFVVTSSTGDVIHDIIRTRNLRDNSVNIFIFPCLVQGLGCRESVSNAVRKANAVMRKVTSTPELNKYGFSYDNTVLIVARGGGSFDDLLPFNDEEVVKSFAESQLLVISAIGHEQNRPLCNYSADVYVSTPTQAAEVAIADRQTQVRHFRSLFQGLVRGIERIYRYELQNFDNMKQVVDMSLDNIKTRMGGKLFQIHSQLLSRLSDIYSSQCSRFEKNLDVLRNQATGKFEKEVVNFEHLKSTLHNISPKKVMERGYCVIEDEYGATIARASELKSGVAELTFFDAKKKIKVDVME